jgi:primosomal protein N' (replication factor Y)
MLFLSIAIPAPLRRSFDYLPPEGMSASEVASLEPGIRVSAPFAGRQLTGILLSVKQESDVPASQLKAVSAILDSKPVLSSELLTLGLWAASYYQHPIGDVLANTLPTLLRKGETLIKQTEIHWRLSSEGKGLPEGGLKRAKKQAQLLALLQQMGSVSPADLNAHAINRQTSMALLDKQLIEAFDA